MIFVTVGSQKFQFNRLLKKIDELIENKVIEEEVFAQIGASDYKPIHYNYVDFLDMEEFKKKTNECDLFLTHGGTGAIVGAVKKGKKVIAIPRLARYGEHIDDHQLQLLKQFEGMGIVEVCWNLEELESVLNDVINKEYQSYTTNTKSIMDSIESFLNDWKTQ